MITTIAIRGAFNGDAAEEWVLGLDGCLVAFVQWDALRLVEPDAGVYLPALQPMQSEASSLPVVDTYLPPAQTIQSDRSPLPMSVT